MSNRESIKVGIPRALLYYKFADLWITYFEKLGAEVRVSPKTTKTIKDIAVGKAPEEDCYSTKLFFGHAMALMEEVDFLFIPRFGGKTRKLVGCPKFIGLAEVFRSMVPESPKILMPHYNRGMDGHTRFGLVMRAMKLGKIFTKDPFRRFGAIVAAFAAHRRHYRELIIDEKTLRRWETSEILLNDTPVVAEGERPVKIALVGHSYVLNDPYSSLNIRALLRDQGADIITSEQLPRPLVEKQMATLEYDLYFDFEREILGTVMHFLESGTVDGIIHMMIFSCGPDSIAGEIASRFSKRNPEVPMLQLVFDELTGEAGMRTRIEAFTDMLRRSIEKHTHPEMVQVHI